MLVWICMFSLERHFPFYFKTHILWTYHTVKGCTGQVFTLVMFLKWKTENNSNGHQENARYTVDIIQPTKKKVTAPYVSICPVYTFLTLKKAHKAVCTLCYHFVLFIFFLVGGTLSSPIYIGRYIFVETYCISAWTPRNLAKLAASRCRNERLWTGETFFSYRVFCTFSKVPTICIDSLFNINLNNLP